VEGLRIYGIELNKKKSQILRGLSILKTVPKIMDIPVCDKVKYLRFTLSPTKSELIGDTKTLASRNLKFIQICFGLPLVVCCAWTLDDITVME